MLEINPMEERFFDDICEIERLSFSVPWSRQTLLDDINNPWSLYFVAAADGKAVGYAGMWHIVNEGHVTNIAVAPGHRGIGVGTALLERLIAEAEKLGLIGILLEVRVGNYAAQRIYTRKGFLLDHIRKNYYQDTGEDALVMWKSLRA